MNVSKSLIVSDEKNENEFDERKNRKNANRLFNDSFTSTHQRQISLKELISLDLTASCNTLYAFFIISISHIHPLSVNTICVYIYKIQSPRNTNNIRRAQERKKINSVTYKLLSVH